MIWRVIRAKVKDFIESEIYPKETELSKGTPEAREMLGSLMQLAKDEKIWALGHHEDIGGGGMPFTEYVYVNEVIGKLMWGNCKACHNKYREEH